LPDPAGFALKRQKEGEKDANLLLSVEFISSCKSNKTVIRPADGGEKNKGR
jgi:hypothetical protein